MYAPGVPPLGFACLPPRSIAIRSADCVCSPPRRCYDKLLLLYVQRDLGGVGEQEVEALAVDRRLRPVQTCPYRERDLATPALRAYRLARHDDRDQARVRAGLDRDHR